jgi:hypothetical protein
MKSEKRDVPIGIPMEDFGKAAIFMARKETNNACPKDRD